MTCFEGEGFSIDRASYMKISFSQGFSFCSWSVSKAARFTRGNVVLELYGY